MKTGKQFLALTLGLLLVLGLFAGCQQEKAPATEPSTEPVTEAPTEAPTEEPTEALRRPQSLPRSLKTP